MFNSKRTSANFEADNITNFNIISYLSKYLCNKMLCTTWLVERHSPLKKKHGKLFWALTMILQKKNKALFTCFHRVMKTCTPLKACLGQFKASAQILAYDSCTCFHSFSCSNKHPLVLSSLCGNKQNIFK